MATLKMPWNGGFGWVKKPGPVDDSRRGARIRAPCLQGDWRTYAGVEACLRVLPRQ